MKSQRKTPLDLSKSIPKHKKRSKHKSPKKANHKHDYYDIVVKINYKGTDLYYLGYKCKICGHVSNNMHFFDKDGMIINKKIVEKKYSHLDIVEIEW